MKHDRKNGGVGIHLFNDIEELYNLASCTACSFPFVVQPYRDRYRDLRVIILDDYVEAYERINPDNFRQNLHCGGRASPHTLSDRELTFCREVMQRGKMDPRWGAVKLLEADPWVAGLVGEGARSVLNRHLKMIEAALDEEADILVADSRYELIGQSGRPANGPPGPDLVGQDRPGGAAPAGRHSHLPGGHVSHLHGDHQSGWRLH